MLFSGLDFGRQVDHSALAIVEGVPTMQCIEFDGERETPTGFAKCTERREWPGLPVSYSVRHLERWELGTRLPDVVGAVKDRLAAAQTQWLATDATGQGMSLVDFAREEGLESLPIVMTAGEVGGWTEEAYHEPRTSMLMRLFVALEGERLTFAEDLELAPVLADELQGITQTRGKTGRLTLQHPASGHDDLLVAVGLAVLLAELCYGQTPVWTRPTRPIQVGEW